MRPELPIPSPPEIDEHPELAILAALELCLDLAVRTLVAHYPVLADPERPYWCRNHVDPPAHANSVIAAASSLQDALNLYHRDITTPDDIPPPDDDRDLDDDVSW